MNRGRSWNIVGNLFGRVHTVTDCSHWVGFAGSFTSTGVYHGPLSSFLTGDDLSGTGGFVEVAVSYTHLTLPTILRV